ncbi:hypothetical protein G6F65_017863 [Rhizopus arrhizus]|nr:hypothetical protein G6F65_017863 [Rhizopus arrhizus]
MLPEDTTMPSTFSAWNAVLFHSANGTSTKPASVHEEAQQDDQPGEEHHDDGRDVHEHLRKSRHVADLLEDRRPGVDADLGQPARLQEVLHAQGRAAGGQAQARERTEHDAGQPVEVADDVGEGADVQHLADQLGDHVLALAGGMSHRPEEPGDGHVDDDQRGSEKGHLAMQQAKARVDVARERIEETVDDGHVVHGESSCPGPLPSAGSSKLGGIGGRSAGVGLRHLRAERAAVLARTALRAQRVQPGRVSGQCIHRGRPVAAGQQGRESEQDGRVLHGRPRQRL